MARNHPNNTTVKLLHQSGNTNVTRPHFRSKRQTLSATVCFICNISAIIIGLVFITKLLRNTKGVKVFRTMTLRLCRCYSNARHVSILSLCCSAVDCNRATRPRRTWDSYFWEVCGFRKRQCFLGHHSNSIFVSGQATNSPHYFVKEKQADHEYMYVTQDRDLSWLSRFLKRRFFCSPVCVTTNRSRKIQQRSPKLKEEGKRVYMAT